MKKLLIFLGVSAICTTGALAKGPNDKTSGQASAAMSMSAFDGTAPFIPKGYRLAWSDDRLNPLRGVGTAQGEAKMNLIWTNDIPRKLVEN